MKESARSLLVYQLRQPAKPELIEHLQKTLTPMAAKLNAEVVVTDSLGDLSLHPGSGQLAELIDAMREQCTIAREQTAAFVAMCQTAAELMQLLVDQEAGTDDDYETPKPEYLEQRVRGQ